MSSLNGPFSLRSGMEPLPTCHFPTGMNGTMSSFNGAFSVEPPAAYYVPAGKDRVIPYFALMAVSTYAVRSFLHSPRVVHRVPSSVPLPIWVLVQLFLNPLDVLLSSGYFACAMPIRFNLYLVDIFFNQGPANVAALFNNNNSLSAYFLHGPLLRKCFNMSKTALQAYMADNSGPAMKPLPGTSVAAHNRLEYPAYKWHHEYLVGPGLAPLCAAYERSLAARLASFRSKVHAGQTHGRDLMGVFKELLMGPAIVDAIAGPSLIERQPEFLASLWVVHDEFWALASGLPSWLVPKPRAALKASLASIKSWHAWARGQSPPEEEYDTSGRGDRIWGSKYIRERQLLADTVDGFTRDDIASHDLAFLWAASHNTLTSAFWLVVDVFNNMDILRRVRAEAEACILEPYEDGLPRFDVARLARQPYLQAVYAETLRLRTHGVIVRQIKQPLQVNNWRFSKNSFVATSSTTAHMNEAVWSSNGLYPIGEFHPERFLVPSAADGSKQQDFSMAAFSGSWIPFGGGNRACPGRHFAKRETILTLAMLASMFDVEVCAPEKDLEMSGGRFGFGVLEPKGRVPFQITLR